MEILVVLILFGLVSTAIYRFLYQYSRGYLKVTEKMENVAEGWQLLRLLNDDLVFSDLPGFSMKTWETADLVQQNRLPISRRRGKDISRVTYEIDKETGNISREENGKKIRFLNARCKEFSVGRGIKPTEKQNNRQDLFYRVKLAIGEIRETSETAKPVSIETLIFPTFLNRKVQSRYVHEGFPADPAKNP
jgi:hypothetical protein